MFKKGLILDEYLRRIVWGGGGCTFIKKFKEKKGRKNERKGEIGGYKRKSNEMERKGDF